MSAKAVQKVTKARLGMMPKILAVVAILGIITTMFDYVDAYKAFLDLFKSEYDKYEEEVFIKGIKLPEYILKNQNYLHFKLGSSDLYYRGIRTNGTPFTIDSWLKCDWTDNPINLWFRLDGDRLRVYDTVRYIANREVIALIDFDKAALFKPNLFDYYSDDKSLEIVDRSNQIAFSISLVDDSVVALQGYFISTTNIAMISKSLRWCLQPSDLSAETVVSEMMKNAERVDRTSAKKIEKKKKLRIVLAASALLLVSILIYWKKKWDKFI